jgi:tetratricopeptide (TPR) repeat protein
MDKLLELHSGPPVLGRAAQIYRDQGWREDAAAMAYDAMTHAEAPTEKADGLHRLGELAWERGEPAEAVGYYDAALWAAGDHHRSLAGRARALAALGRTEEAFRDYRAALTHLPLPEYALEAGELYESMGLDEDARAQYELLRERVARAGKHGVNQELVLARFEADHGDSEAAVRRLRGEWRRGHRSVYVADALGWALYRAGEAEEALSFAEKATDQGLRNALFSYHRGEIERALEMDGPARRRLAEALRTNPHFSPLLAEPAREALTELGEPAGGGPAAS